jgi:hypothetical protein
MRRELSCTKKKMAAQKLENGPDSATPFTDAEISKAVIPSYAPKPEALQGASGTIIRKPTDPK